MEYKIIACDLDGTLLDKNGKISDENWNAIKKLNELGIQFVPASGRAFSEMPKEICETPYIRYYITSSGATVYDKMTNSTHETAIPPDVSKRILDKLYQYSNCMMIHADINSYVDVATHNDEDYTKFNMNSYWKEFSFAMEKPIHDLKTFAYNHDKLQLIVPFFENADDVIECKKYFEQDKDIIVAQSYAYNLELMAANSGKGNSLMFLADLLGVDRKSTIAVGDSNNDYTMIKAAGLGLAMKNAVKDLQSAADEVICKNDEHCAKYILERYI